MSEEVEKTVVEPQVEQEAQQNQEAVVEQKPILIVGTTEAKVRSYLKGYCTKNKIEALVMSDEEVANFIMKTKAADQKYKDSVQFRSLKAFLESEDNRKNAYEQALKLFTIMTRNVNIEDADKYEFTNTECVRNTTLSHSQFKNIFEIWELFNLVQKTGTGKNKFRFVFNKERQRNAIDKQVKSLMRAMISDIQRYNNNVDNDETLTNEQKEKMKKDMLDSVLTEL